MNRISLSPLQRSSLVLIILLAFFGRVAVRAGVPTIPLSLATPYTQNFDTLGVAAVASLPFGFRADTQPTFRTVGTHGAAALATEFVGAANLPTNAAAGIYNFGAGSTPTGGVDRAVGFLSGVSNASSGNLYARFSNSTSNTFYGLQISYGIEKYRNGANSAGYTIQLYFSSDGSNWTNAGPNFRTYLLPNVNDNGYATAPGSQVLVTNQLGVTVGIGGIIYLCWNYSADSGFSGTHAMGLAIDDVSVLGTALPSVVTLPPSPVAKTSATLLGSVNADGLLTSAWFQWGQTANYGITTAITNVGSGSSTQAVFQNLTGLTPGRTYHYRVAASNTSGVVFGGDAAFTTVAPHPEAGPGYALSFDGLDDHARLGDLAHGLAQGTVEMWFKARTWNWSGANDGLYLWTGGQGLPNSSAGDGINLGNHKFFAGNGQLMFGIYEYGSFNNWHWAYSGIVPATNTWYHVAGTWGPGGIKIYVNGALAGTNFYTGPAPSYTSTNLLGCSTWPGSFFNGLIDELRIWNVARSQSQIQTNKGRALTGSEPGLVAYFPFNEGLGLNAYDGTVNAKTATLVNGVAWVPATSRPSVPQIISSSAYASSDGTNVALTFNAVIDPNGLSTTAWFNWGSTIPLTHSTSPVNIGSGGNPESTSAYVPGQAANQTYSGEAKATNSEGSTVGIFFVDPAPPPDLSATNGPQLAQAVAAAVAHQRVVPGPGLLQVPYTLVVASTNCGLIITQGLGADVTTLAAAGGQRVFEIDCEAFISGVTISNYIPSGFMGDGAAVIVNSSGIAHFKDCVFRSNKATGQGGAIYNLGTLILQNCTFMENEASSGGALATGSTAGNSASVKATLINCTIVSNSASAQGGGILVAADTSLNSCTVAANAAASCGGIKDAASGFLLLRNTIVAGNRVPTPGGTAPDITGSLRQPGSAFNLIGSPDGNSGWVASDQLGIISNPLNPLLGRLDLYGGHTPTMLLLPGSPAIDRGNGTDASGAAVLANDQRYAARPANLLNLTNAFGDYADIGAFEVKPGLDATSPPMLTYQVLPGPQIKLLWDISAQAYTLESATSVLPPHTWSPVTANVAKEPSDAKYGDPSHPGNYVYSFDPTLNPPTYYRLRAP